MCYASVVPIQTKDASGGDTSLLTLEDFIKLAADRGRRLWLEPTSSGGARRITDGTKRHSLPRLPRGLMPSRLVRVLLDLFFDADSELLAVDFALDPRRGD
jgi:hypothetical protein